MDIIGRHQGMMEEVGNLLKEKSSLETIVAELSVDLDDAQRKLQSANSALEMEKNDKLSKEKDRDDAIRMLANVLSEKLEMKKEKDCVVKEAEELRVREAGMLFSLTQLEEATNRFDPGHKIGQGAAGTVYKGRIAQTVVAIKKLNDVRVLQCGHPLQQEMRGIYMIRHPRLVAQIGACLQPPILVYEYLPNGNLRDRLNGSDPLPWQIRIRIAAEICDALLFLHSVAIYHGNLTPNNVLLDPNLHAKIDLGFCAPIKKQSPDPKDWDPMGPLYYTDPETRSTGALTTKSDAYSFGAILLEMLTGRPGVLVPDQPDPEEVDEGYLEGVLDPSAGAWPFIQAVQLANLGLRCCSSSAESRPNLQSEVWKVLDTIRSSSTSMAGFHGPDGSRRPPDYFVCPITQEIMSDPHVAADGYTYEKEALHGWLEGGRANSPMTNLPLSHLTLTPNYALRPAIQEWQDRP